MTPDLDAHKARLASMTQGPLVVSGDGQQIFQQNGGLVADCDAQWADDDDDEGREGDQDRNEANAKAIVALVNAAGELIAEIERLQGEREAVFRAGFIEGAGELYRVDGWIDDAWADYQQKNSGESCHPRESGTP